MVRLQRGMAVRPQRLRWCVLALLVGSLLSPIAGGAPAGAAAPAPDERCFAETEHCLAGRFLEYWQQHGGPAVFGYPITPARWEPNRDEAAVAAAPVVWSQWFERARFEHHPDQPAPFDVLLGRLGSERLAQHGRAGTAAPAGQSSPDCHRFATGYTLCDRLPGGEAIGFRSYYARHGLRLPGRDTFAGSVALFGLPLTQPQPETNASGQTVVTQWFERGRFEWHPANPAPTRVLLGLLGTEVAEHQSLASPRILGAAADDAAPSETRVTAAVWSDGAAPVYLTATALQAGEQPVAGTVAEVVPLAAGHSTATVAIRLADARARAESTAIRVCQMAFGTDPTASQPTEARACLTFPHARQWAPASAAARASRAAAIEAGDPFRGVCRVSQEGFRRLLRQQAAPAVLAERDPGEYWDAIRGQRIDPLLVAAIFQHESRMGALGTARTTHSWGNTRAPSFGATPVGTVAGRSGSFPVFASWLDGAVSTAARLSTSQWVYADRTSIGAIFVHPSGQVWAPSGDGNNPDGYLRTVLAFMNRFADQAAAAC